MNYPDNPNKERGESHLNKIKDRITIDDIFMDLKLPKEVQILDVACGVGNIGKRLQSEGYINIDGLDPVQGYLEVASSIYGKTYKEFIDDKIPTSIPDGFYDVVICGAGFFHGLIPFKGLMELLRLVNGKGLVIWSIALTRESSVNKKENDDDHSEIVNKMVKDGHCKVLHRIQCEKLAFTDSGAAYLSGYMSSGVEALGIVYIVQKK
ncbi:methyltransferase-like protein 27 [Lepeophtheirus salmonis]|uniref:methyltransferase-like protein 27 n=1 Tax=Lepeophtheirus salmonis TaxID=72036 RepID=UPI001AE330E8|nr:uncharacterized protein LOC121125677 [Lepeophtheirus salmonis]